MPDLDDMAMMDRAPYAEGGNFRVVIVDARAQCRVWSRPDTDSDTGARFAQSKIAVFHKLSREPVTSLLYDLSQAPSVAGPKTQESLRAMLAPWHRASKPVAIVIGSTQIQTLQMQRIIGTFPQGKFRLFRSEPDAMHWLDDVCRIAPGPL